MAQRRARRHIDPRLPIAWVEAHVEGPLSPSMHALLTWVLGRWGDHSNWRTVDGRRMMRVALRDFGPIDEPADARWLRRTVEAWRDKNDSIYATVKQIRKGAVYANPDPGQRIQIVRGIERLGDFVAFDLDDIFLDLLWPREPDESVYVKYNCRRLSELNSLAAQRLFLWSRARSGLHFYGGWKTKRGRKWISSLADIAGVLGVSGQRPDAVHAALRKALEEIGYGKVWSLVEHGPLLMCTPKKSGRGHRLEGFEFMFDAVPGRLLPGRSRTQRERTINLWDRAMRPLLWIPGHNLATVVEEETFAALAREPEIAAVGGREFVDEMAGHFLLRDLREGDDVDAMFSEYVRGMAQFKAHPKLWDLRPDVLEDFLR